jgi:hypothetical protein
MDMRQPLASDLWLAFVATVFLLARVAYLHR